MQSPVARCLCLSTAAPAATESSDRLRRGAARQDRVADSLRLGLCSGTHHQERNKERDSTDLSRAPPGITQSGAKKTSHLGVCPSPDATTSKSRPGPWDRHPCCPNSPTPGMIRPDIQASATSPSSARPSAAKPLFLFRCYRINIFSCSSSSRYSLGCAPMTLCSSSGSFFKSYSSGFGARTYIHSAV